MTLKKEVMIEMNKQEYKKFLENALRFHKVNKSKVDIKQVEKLLENLNKNG